MEQFNASIGYDKRMWRQDIAGSIAYAAALGRAGLLKAEEVSSLQAGLQKVRAEWEEGKFELKPGDEVSDIFSFSILSISQNIFVRRTSTQPTKGVSQN